MHLVLVQPRLGRRLAAVLVAAVLIASALVLRSGSTASAVGYYNGWHPWLVSGCSSNVRAGSVVNIETATGYYGWAEMRYSTSGSCYGYQWVRLHVTHTMALHPLCTSLGNDPCSPPADLWVFAHEVGGNNFVVNSTQNASFTSSTLPYEGWLYSYPGVYDQGIMYVTWHKICSSLTGYGDDSDPWYFYGFNHTHSNDDGAGNWCA